MKLEGDHLVLASGNRVYCNQGIVGLGVEGPVWEVYEGYDGGLGDLHTLSTPDWLEIADHMIARWQAFRAEAEKHL